ncbi:ATP-grasp domain-containing protein [Pseudomonas sp. PA-6-1D]|nr:ATP-grasp domain-containing protein [Pseudomonas sp. PA-6-3C]MCF5149055.1 ATP-grasp domain-containing protein [Pseudomonas sp. PA-6-3F]MCF5160384.1 ATP-grasp domain-containing protein [Pseudomonas sp. PA-6-2E]MCF5174343.1 ATP-grasp domain-containing protein [Pseudomonas sp. PA-6-1D]MCF5195239.1 ATP-grasp domain-containing protein [Pseudomonas sp. PA-6-1H]MCF8973003.1 ATP-grasp domain-containing protein [Pseudomonas edaphica]
MKQDAILFIDVDDSASVRYCYREPHFAVARAQGLACLTAGVAGREHLQRLRDDSDAVFLLDALNEQSILALVGRLDGQYQIRAIFCQAGHPSAQGEVGCIVAQACRRLGLVHSDPLAIAACNNKFLMRRALKKLGVRSVPFALCNNEQQLREGAEQVGYPLIAKPPFGGASAFIKKCSDWAQLRSHYAHFLADHASAAYADFYGCAHTLPEDDGQRREYLPGRSLLLEGFIPGIEGSVECVVAGEQVHALLINEKLMLTERSGTVLENLLISPPTSFTDAQCEQIRQYAVECLRAVGLTNAVVHFEFRMTDAGPVVIEINPRVGGLYVNAAFRDLAGIDPYQLYLSLLLGEPGVNAQLDAGARQVAQASQHYSMLAIYPEHSGHFKGIEGLEWLAQQPAVLEYAQQESGHSIDADIEEHYLLKCWARVDDAAHAHAVHDAIRHNLRVIIDNKG